MRSKKVKLVLLAFFVLFALATLIPKGEASLTSESDRLFSTGLGSVETLEANYKAWAANFDRNGGERNIVMPLVSGPGTSTGKASAIGIATLNLIDKRVSVEVRGFSDSDKLDFWLIDNSGGAIAPEPGDAMVRVGALSNKRGVASLDAAFGDQVSTDFDPDFIAITSAGKSPIEDRLLTGQTTLFHKLYHSEKEGRFGVLAGSDNPTQPTSEKGLLEKLADLLSPTAHAQVGPLPNPSTALEQLITQGRNVFFNGTFAGNGRTCGSCHREENNLTIDPDFISTLPPNDPLFVAEFTPALSQNFENPHPDEEIRPDS